MQIEKATGTLKLHVNIVPCITKLTMFENKSKLALMLVVLTATRFLVYNRCSSTSPTFQHYLHTYLHRRVNSRRFKQDNKIKRSAQSRAQSLCPFQSVYYAVQSITTEISQYANFIQQNLFKKQSYTSHSCKSYRNLKVSYSFPGARNREVPIAQLK